MKGLLKYLIILLIACTGLEVTAQKDVLYIFGQLKEKENKKRLDGVQVIVYKDGGQFDIYNSGTSGKYEFTLPLGFVYDIKFSKTDYLSKIVRIDTRNIPEEDKAGGFEADIAGELFKAPEGFNTDLLKDPMALAAFDNQTNSISFDFDYTEKRQKAIDAEFKRLDDIKKNFAKLKAQFDQLIADGDKKMIEEKYQDALDKYTAALAIFPKDEVAIGKRDAAKAKVDELNANKELEAKYKKLIESGDANFKSEKWAEARKNYKDAIELKNEKYPKEQLYQIDLAEADAKNRAEYKSIIADADKKFENEDYAVSIERYKAASVMYPSEVYPKDQITKAQRALDNMLAGEAEKQRIKKEYDDKIALAERNFKDDKLDLALKNYREAASIKPDEDLPGKKIPEIEALIAERKAKSDAEALAANSNAEKERIEKEYNDHIARADDFFSKEKWLDAKSAYEAALLVKSDAQYPKTRIERIDMLLKQAGDSLYAARQKAIADSIRNAQLANMDEGTRKRLAMQQKAKEDFENRMRILEDQRQAEAQKVIDNKTRNRNLTSNVNAKAEDEVEEYYRDARQKEEASRYNEIIQEKDENSSFYITKSKKSNAAITSREEKIGEKRAAITEMEERGASANLRAVSNGDKKKKQAEENTKAYQESAVNRQTIATDKVAKKVEAQESLAANDRYRTNKVLDMDDTKNRVAKNQSGYEKKGNAVIKNNQLEVEEQNERNRTMTFEGEEVRKKNEEKVAAKIEENVKKNAEEKKSADERVISAGMKIEEKKKSSERIGDGKQAVISERAGKIADKKQEEEFTRIQKEQDSANARFERRNELLEKNKGEQKSEEEYLPVSGSESMPEGVTENSYKLGNKMVTERTVKVGNKVDSYRKVVSKTGIYYFKNDHSITEVIWDQETLGLPK